MVFYSRVGENYQVGVIEEGNTAKVAKEIAALVKPGGRLILSGILDELYPEVAAAYAPLGFSETESELIGEWRTGLFAKAR